MEFLKRTVTGTPYVGLFGVVTESFALFPESMEPKEMKGLGAELRVPIIQSRLAGTALNGIFMAATGNKAVVAHIVEEAEVQVLEGQGVEVRRLSGPTAWGNLVAVNAQGGIASPLLDKTIIRELGEFFGVEMVQRKVAGTDIPGAAFALTNKGFIAHPNISETEFKEAEEVFGVNGAASTSNYGDLFPGNNILANSHAAIVGTHTSGPEMARIDEGLRGDA